LKDEERLLQRVVHLQQIVDSAQQLQKRLGTPRRTDKARQKFDQALELAHKVLADRDEKRKEKSDRTLSVVDQDARRNKHGSYYDGYLLDISMDADSEIITALDVLPSNGDEAANAIELIQSEESAQGNDIEEMSIDSIGFRGDVIKGLRDKFSLSLFAVPQAPQYRGVFGADKFLLDQTGEVLTCPGGQQSSCSYLDRKGHGRSFRFSQRLCKSCPLLEQCLGQMPKGAGRTVFKSFYEAEYKEARERTDSERYKQVRKQHPKVERKIADIVCHHNGREARYWGSAKVRIQFLMLAMVVNIKRIVSMVKSLTITTESALIEV